METSKVGADVALHLERRLAAPPERVFDAWTRPEALIRWFGPDSGYSTRVHELDVRPGGRYRIEIQGQGRDPSVCHGTYREVSRPGRLVFTWQWESRPDMPLTVVTVTIEPDGTGSRLVLTHEHFADSTDRDNHEKGWTGCLAQLPGVLA